MQLLTDEQAEQAELRAQLADDNFLRKQREIVARKGIENSEDRFRVHEFTRSAMLLPNFSEYDRIKELIDGLIDELDVTDFLGCTTALELLAEIAASGTRNIEFFGRVGLLARVYSLFRMTKEDPDLGILHIACIRFFGYLSTADSNALSKFPLFTADVFDSVNRFDAFDATRRQLAFETLAVICSTSGAKQFLSRAECPYNMQKALNHLGVAVATAGPPELKVRHLDSVRMLFDSFDPRRSEETNNILPQWFRWLGDPFPQLLLQYLRSTLLAEVQQTTLKVLLALTWHKWALDQFCQLKGFIDLLVDRSVGFNAEGHRLKHDLVRRVAESGSSAINVGQLELLRDYVAKGPFWPAPRMEIATEGTD